MSFSRAIQWYHSHVDPDSIFKLHIGQCFCSNRYPILQEHLTILLYTHSCIFLGLQALSTFGSQYDRQLRQSFGDIRPLPVTYGHFRWPCQNSQWSDFRTLPVTKGSFPVTENQLSFFFFLLTGGFCWIFFFFYCIQHCFICRPSDFTVSEYAGIEPRTVATSALTVRRFNHTARFHPHVENQLSGTYWHTRQQKGNIRWQTVTSGDK